MVVAVFTQGELLEVRNVFNAVAVPVRYACEVLVKAFFCFRIPYVPGLFRAVLHGPYAWLWATDLFNAAASFQQLAAGSVDCF